MAVAKFALASVAALVVLAGISAFVLARMSRDEAVRDAKVVTEVVGKEVVQPKLSDALLRGDPRAQAALDRVLRQRVTSGEFVRVKIWSPTGRILYSDVPQLIGSRFKLAADERAALRRDGVQAAVSDLSRAENRYERRRGKLLEVYMPLKTQGGRPVMFETYLPYSSVTATGRDLWGRFLPALIGTLLALALIQLPLARSLAWRVERANRGREEALQRALDASEVERRRIAADLHDGTVQDLVGATYGLAAARERTDADDDHSETLRQAENSTRSAVRQLRSLLVEIYPPRLRESGLSSALEDLAMPLERRGIQVGVDAPALDLPYETTALLYRVAREAVRNVQEHARPREVRIGLARGKGSVRLEVADDGVGFVSADTLHDPAAGHFGLRLIADQVRDVNGTLEIESSPGAGTTVRVEVPSA